ncbi:MAG: glycine cleavage system aminomethyltransferase GcvT [Deltaproteobacteria bacterium]|nr:glycine cleavage system aminomethyltransferase GcvT [Deltaproteobacteria bacterium]
MATLKKTALYDLHQAAGANMVEFGGWDMPISYPTGIVQEHLATRHRAGLFDVSHMGRFWVRGPGAVPLLQHVLTNNAAALDIRTKGAQYTHIQTHTGGAVDDAYLYHFDEGEYLLVVNAANAQKDWDHLQGFMADFKDVELTDWTPQSVMLALQGPGSRAIMKDLVQSGPLPEPVRNAVSSVKIQDGKVRMARTGYTGEPLGFELFVDGDQGVELWERMQSQGATPAGLGARDTLRLEAGLPLYGHELGTDREGREIPIWASPLARFAVSFSPLKGDFYGREALKQQHEAYERIVMGDFSRMDPLPRMIKPLTVLGKGVAREGADILKDHRRVGYVTSGTRIPLWSVQGEGLTSQQTDAHQLRSICLTYVESDLLEGDQVTIDIRGKHVEAAVVPYHLRSDAPPYARPIIFEQVPGETEAPLKPLPMKVKDLLEKTVHNTRWRQQECINLIPSEMTPSPMVRLLSVMDPAFRYAEHRQMEAFYDTDIFYYQGTDFIHEVEQMLEAELKAYLGCSQVETRLISGQTANMAVYGALVDYVNRADRKREPRRLGCVMNHGIGKGGHLSAQPMGALKDFVARDPQTERPAVVNFPVLPENPFQIDVPLTLELIHAFRPELIIFGKSMVLHREPVAPIRDFLRDQGIPAVVLYDMAHVLGLVGPHFQHPFEEGADLITGSTHKTFFGTQRGVAGSRFEETETRYALWEALRNRAFPGGVSNHHLGTLLGLLMAAYEMNHFKETYQPRVIANAKAFARALRDCGLQVAGDPDMDFTETHQVVVEVGYAHGPDIARRLEANHLICNFQAMPDEEGFTASGALRLGVSEMTRFGMDEAGFKEVAQLMSDVIQKNARVTQAVKRLRRRYRELQFCFKDSDYDPLLHDLHGLI